MHSKVRLQTLTVYSKTSIHIVVAKNTRVDTSKSLIISESQRPRPIRSLRVPSRRTDTTWRIFLHPSTTLALRTKERVYSARHKELHTHLPSPKLQRFNRPSDRVTNPSPAADPAPAGLHNIAVAAVLRPADSACGSPSDARG